MTCINCKSGDGRPVFRTNPLGEVPAGWMCRPCIDGCHDSSLIDAETQELADLLSGSCTACHGAGGKRWTDTREGRQGDWRIACAPCKGSGKATLTPESL